MPKRKVEVPPSTFTPRSRRAASKEALKQMQILLDDEDEESETFTIPSDDDVNIVAVQPPPKKKYKLSHRKSSDGNDRDVIVLKTVRDNTRESRETVKESPREIIREPTPVLNVNAENTLELDCWVEELSDIQKEIKKKYDEETKQLESKLESIIKSANCQTVHKTDLASAFEITEPIQTQQTSNIILQPQGGAGSAQSYQLVMDPRLGLIVGTVATTNTAPSKQPPPLASKQPSVFKGKVQISQAVKAVANATAADDDSPVRQTRTRTRNAINKSEPPPLARTSRAAAAAAAQQSLIKPTTSKVNTPPQVTKATTATKVVLPKPSSVPVTRLRSTPTTSAQSPQTQTTSRRVTELSVEGGLSTGSKRNSMVDLTEENPSQPDSREIAFNKLQGKTYPSLVVVARPHMRVKDLNLDRGKLDTKVKAVLMYSPTKFTEWLIQQGLVRSEQKCSIHTNTQLKLGMYSDVSKFPYSGGYVWISECCPQHFVSVFSRSLFEGSPHPPVVILKLLYHWSCQTNIQNVTQWVKVDNLYVKGFYTWLRSVCTVAIHTHLKQLGGPGSKIEVGVISLGTTSQDGNQRQVKVEVLGILETTTKFLRLRAVEPDSEKNYKKRFLKILEPVMHWVHPQSTIITDLTVDKATLINMGFTNVIQNTSTEYGNSNKTIMEYLRQVVPRMFQNTLSLLSRQIIQQFLDELVWREWFGVTSSQAFDNIVIHLAEQTRAELGTSLITRLNKVSTNPFKGWALTNQSNFTLSKSSTTPTGASDTPRRYGRSVKKPAPAPATTSAPEATPPRPAKSVSPDVPEQMVPLENYYYGTIEGPNRPEEKVNLNMKCPFCKLSMNNNIALMHHLFKHAHNISGDTKLCRYCLTGVSNNTDLMNHIATSHPSETKMMNGFVCLICETQFMNPFILGKHMSREHCPYELPYQCGSCSYRCSNHKEAVDHFYRSHSNGPAIQCPFCLKSTQLVSGGRYIVQNMNYFIQHLQKHQKKQIAKRCGKCNLWFVQKDLLKEHQNKMHVSQRGKPRLVPWTAPRNCVMVPKSKTDQVPDDEDINYSSLTFSVTKNLFCKECDLTLDSPGHLSSFDTCTNTNCHYSTCCANAMKNHITNCKVFQEVLPKEPLPHIMFCICNFSSNDGNVMAKHLAICEKKSAYPSRASANKATVKQSMLDVLGLVRKPEESPATETKSSSKSETAAAAAILLDADNTETPKASAEDAAKKSEAEVVECDTEKTDGVTSDIVIVDTSKDGADNAAEFRSEGGEKEVEAEGNSTSEADDTTSVMNTTTESDVNTANADTETALPSSDFSSRGLVSLEGDSDKDDVDSSQERAEGENCADTDEAAPKDSTNVDVCNKDSSEVPSTEGSGTVPTKSSCDSINEEESTKESGDDVAVPIDESTEDLAESAKESVDERSSSKDETPETESTQISNTDDEVGEAKDKDEENATSCETEDAESQDSVVSQSVLDALAAECANTAKPQSSTDTEDGEKMEVDGDAPQLENSLIESETPMETDES